MNSFFKKLVTGTAVLALSMSAFASVSLAANTSTIISGGSLGYTGITATNFESVTLNGTTQTVGAQIDAFNITDARGTGAGWNVSVSATQFSHDVRTEKLAAGALGLAAPTVTKVDENSDLVTTISTLSGTIDNDTAIPVKILSAAVDGGKGSYSSALIPMTLTLMPKEVYAGTYTSTITATLTATP